MQELQSAEYILLHQSFREWLTLLNYSPGTIQVIPGHVREFLHHQEQAGKTQIGQITALDAQAFAGYLKGRKGPRTGRLYSNGHLNKYTQALQLLSRYLRESGQAQMGLSLRWMPPEPRKAAWLTLAEITRLYESTADDVLGVRDRAMLAVYYGCGLRLNEGASLEIKDILLDRGVVHVRNGKGYKERFVPLAAANKKALEYYIQYGRPELLQQHATNVLFIGANRGLPMHTQSIYVRIKQLVKKARIKKKVGTHTLRHSIATHLLQSGMKLERIKDFLGHSSLDSTQIYTHLLNDQR
jgi:site-specific recombinase XerD